MLLVKDVVETIAADEPKEVEDMSEVAIEQVLEQALDALMWASGAPVFVSGGEAEKGWKCIGRPAIEQLQQLLKQLA